jgi:hypothetical protein
VRVANVYDCSPFSTFTVVVTWWPHDEHRNVRLSNPGSSGSIAASTATPPHFGHGILESIGVVPEEGATIIPKPLSYNRLTLQNCPVSKDIKRTKLKYKGGLGYTTELNLLGGRNPARPPYPLVQPCASWLKPPATLVSST